MIAQKNLLIMWSSHFHTFILPDQKWSIHGKYNFKIQVNNDGIHKMSL